MTATVTRAQHDVLLLPIKPHRVGKKDGQSHVEAYDIRAHLNRIFGFAGWSGEVIACELMYESPCEIGQDKKPGYEVGYRVTYQLTILSTGATYTEAAFGGQKMGVKSRGDCHDFAIKTAESQALKRCAINLGDQFGLSLYNRGSLMPLVGTSLVVPEATDPNPGQAPDDHITAPLAPEDAAPEDQPAGPADTEVVTSSPPPPADTPARQAADTPDVVDDIRTRALAATKKVDLARLLSEAGQKKVAGAMTADADGVGMTLETLINARIKALGRAE